MKNTEIYKPKHKIRIVTAASLFDGHDAAINIMRRIMQQSGAEVIHLGHNRSVQEIVSTAIQEDAQAIAITSYQGGHTEYLKYMYDLLKEQGAGHIRIFGGGGGTILPTEIEELHQYGIARIYSPDDGRELGLQGMINDVLRQSDFPLGKEIDGSLDRLADKDPVAIARLISAAENFPDDHQNWLEDLEKRTQSETNTIPVLGITGTGGAGKSSLVDELVRRFLLDFEDKTLAIISVDPSKRKTGGALLGDRIRMNAINSDRVFMRSLATRQSNLALSKYVQSALDILKAAHFDMIILETSGIGQSDTEIIDHSNVSLYVMTPEYGAATQLEKIDMLDFADVIAINKFDKRGALDALRDVKKQYKRNHQLFDVADEDIPVFGTIASQFNDPGTNALYRQVMDTLSARTGGHLKSSLVRSREMSEKIYIIPPNRVRYLSEISESNRSYDRWVDKQEHIARKLFALSTTIDTIRESGNDSQEELLSALQNTYDELSRDLDGHCQRLLDAWEAKKQAYQSDEYTYEVRGRKISVPTHTFSLLKPPFQKSFYLLTRTGVKFSGGSFVKMYLANSPTRLAYSHSNDRVKTPRECLLVREGRNVPINVFTTFLQICLRPVCQQPLTRSPSMARTPITVLTSTGRLVIQVSVCVASMMRKSCTQVSTYATRKHLYP